MSSDRSTSFSCVPSDWHQYCSVSPSAMEVARMKRPLEAVDANAASSNSTSTGTSSDKHTGGPRKKKKKSASRSIDAVLPRAQDVSLSMLPSPQARRKTIDQSIIARGSVERVHHDESRRTISFFLVSTSTSNNLYAELPVVIRGELTGSASLKLLLHEHASMVLTFKEASLGARIPSSTLSNPNYSHASSALFDRYLCFDRGIEFWVSLTSVSAASTSRLPGASSQWTHYRKFANAQQTSQNAAPQALRGPSAPQASPKKATSSEARAREEAGGSGRVHPPSTLPGSMDQVQMQNALLTLFRDSGEAAERPAVLPPSGAPGPSPESGITHIEAGPTQEVDQEDGQEGNQEEDANVHLILDNQPNQPAKAEADANANARLIIRNHPVKEEVGIDASLVFTNQSGKHYHTAMYLRESGIRHPYASVVGVAVHAAGPGWGPAGENVTIRLVDPSMSPSTADDWLQGRWLGLTFLNPEERYLPNVQKGDIVLVRCAQPVPYENYTRLCIYPDQIRDWNILPIESLRACQEGNLHDPLLLGAFRTAPGAAPPDATERQEVLRLALWSRRQLLAQQNGWEVPQEPPAVQAGEPPFAAGLAYLGANPLRRAKDLCVPPGLVQSDCFDIVARLAGPPNQSFNKITLELTDYTPVPGGAGSAHSLRGQEDELEAGILLRTLLWQNEAPDEVVTETMALLQTPNAVFLFRGLRVRLHAGFLNGSGRLNKAEFDVSILDEADPLYAVLADQRLAYRQNRQMLENAAREREALAHPARGWAVMDHAEARAVQNVHEGIPVVHHEAQVAGVGAVANARPAQPARLLSVPPIAAFNLKRLCEVGPPDHPNDHRAFFNCICEIADDGDANDRFSLTILTITDFTINESFWLNMSNAHYPQSRLIMQVAVFGDDQRQKVLPLKQGERVLLQNVRVKFDKQGNLEGHIGDRSNFIVTKLAPDSEQYRQLEANKVALIGTGEGEDNGPVQPLMPPNFDGIACRFAGLPVDNGIFQPLAFESNKMFRLRGRVLVYNPPDLDEILVSKCLKCDRYLRKDERLCRSCDDGVLGANISRQWCLSMRIEVEPRDCNIALDAEVPGRAFWVNVMEEEGETVFFNGLEPREDALPEAKRLLTSILDNRSEQNGTNPIFDFCLRKSANSRVLLMCETAMRRENRGLPWV